MDNNTLTWEAAEYDFLERTPDWFWTLGIIIVAGSLTAIILKDFLFAIVILLAGFTIALFGMRQPPLHRFELSERGVRIGSKLYPYTSLRSFWVADHHDFLPPKLLVTSHKPFVPHLVIPLAEDSDPREIRQFLLPHLKEEEQHESLAHHIFSWLGL